MVLQYFKKKENEYKILADKIYLTILKKSKKLMKKNYFKEVNFDSSFELISIILVFYLKIYKAKELNNSNKINNELMKNFINDIDKSMREIGIGDMNIGKYVKKYVRKFYYRIKLIDPILNEYSDKKFIEYLNKIKTIDKQNSKFMADDLINIYQEIKKFSDLHRKHHLILYFTLANYLKFHIWCFNMAVPKRKTTPSKRNMRRSHHSILQKNIIEDKDSGEPRISHRIDLSTGMYNGRQILKQKSAKEK